MSRLLGANPHKASNDLFSVNFNQDASCVAVGTRTGYSITNCEPFGKVYSKNVGPVSIVEMLFCTSLVAIVGTADSGPSASPRRLQIVNTKRQSTICELLFPTTILAVKLNRRRLVVVLEDEIYIYDISNMKLLHTIETSPNPQAICALSPSSDPCYLAYPSPTPSPSSPLANGAQSPGDVLIFDLLSLQVSNIIQAHKMPIAHLAMNSTGTLLATASDKGTVIRVFSVPTATPVAQFRRGAYPAKIYSISFNAVSTLLSVSSDTETVHIYKLTGAGGAPAGSPSLSTRSALASPAGGGASSPSLGSEDGSENGAGRGGYEGMIDDKKKGSGLKGSLRKRSAALGRLASASVGGYLPSTLSSMWEPQRDFAYLKLPTPGVSSVVAISPTTPQVMVCTSEGWFYTYNLDLEKGGEGALLKQYSLMEGAAGGAAGEEGSEGAGQAGGD
ncbi:WD40 repeat-like protein [Microstroma glucosiphilum]|uniref:Autophagy-related protein 18 n=1 Tax=Pseudomicrostroma glucosiphilum TaxID=1684307 RepID=A0A316U4P3_9BASI|nr:WD40 repeat-like protein [Pseudomicrostroma glucosiphilum]PWN19794.1 WD40 repeat-like protein [Pseudomicrostroma glucosiphilum]